MNNRDPIHFICPICLKGCCITKLTRNEDSLSCSNAHRFKTIQSVPILRPCDELTSQKIKLLKYEEQEFVDMFTWRQYGNYITCSESKAEESENSGFGKMLQIQAGGDIFYRAIKSFADNLVGLNSTILDLGCATGILSWLLAQQYPSSLVFGLDYSPIMIFRAQDIVVSPGKFVEFKIRTSKVKFYGAQIKKKNLNNVQFVVGDAAVTPFSQDTVDIVVTSNLLHRVDSPQAVLEELARITKINGHVIFSNSYDWKTEYTKKQHWFENICDVINIKKWTKKMELDGVPFLIPTYNRKYDLALNHLTVFQRTA